MDGRSNKNFESFGSFLYSGILWQQALSLQKVTDSSDLVFRDVGAVRIICARMALVRIAQMHLCHIAVCMYSVFELLVQLQSLGCHRRKRLQLLGFYSWHEFAIAEGTVVSQVPEELGR